VDCREVDLEADLADSTIRDSHDGSNTSAASRTPVVVLLGHFDHGIA